MARKKKESPTIKLQKEKVKRVKAESQIKALEKLMKLGWEPKRKD